MILSPGNSGKVRKNGKKNGWKKRTFLSFSCGLWHLYVKNVVELPSEKQGRTLTGRCSSLKVWQLGSSSPNFTLEGHEKGVNCIDYYSGGDKPYLISGADDRLVKIWDYQVQFFHNFSCHVLDVLLTVVYKTIKTVSFLSFFFGPHSLWKFPS